MGSVCEADNECADDGTYDGSANECANNHYTNSSAYDSTDNTSNDAAHANPNNASSYNDSNETANCSTSHI